MLKIRRSEERGHAQYDWLDTFHTFSFDTYYDPEHMGFRSLRVINEDRVAPNTGFGTHPHRDMEIITYVLEGTLSHRDSMGNGSTILPGEVQRMSAGTGVTHSEFNNSPTEPVHLLQIWILPQQKGLKPSYEQKQIRVSENPGQLCLIASRDGKDGSVKIHQDVKLYSSRMAPGNSVVHQLEPRRHAWLQVARGEVVLNGVSLKAGDGAAVSEENRLEINSKQDSEILLFDLA